MAQPRRNEEIIHAPLSPGVKDLLRPFAGRALDLLFPPQCLHCRALTEAAGTLCPACWQGVSFITAPQCAACGLPFAYDLGPYALCGECTREAPVFERARAVMIYDDASRDLILAFKYADRTDAAPTYGAWLARAGADLMEDAGLVVPVPLHWTRLFWAPLQSGTASGPRSGPPRGM